MEKEKKFKNKIEYVENLGIFFENLGLPRMSGKIFAWLLVCDPPYQTAAQIAEALQASRGSLSTNLRMLTQFSMIEKIAKHGERSTYYISRPDSLIKTMVTKIKFISDLKNLFWEGIELMADEPPESTERLEGVYKAYDFMEAELAGVIERYQTKIANEK
ncbi:MarR family transcriptional regulator [bacterium]|nr:MarR family transcriptional regulator [bacterium]